MNFYLKLAEQAAELERNKDFASAEPLWGKAATAANNVHNESWAMNRADFCAVWKHKK